MRIEIDVTPASAARLIEMAEQQKCSVAELIEGTLLVGAEEVLLNSVLVRGGPQSQLWSSKGYVDIN